MTKLNDKQTIVFGVIGSFRILQAIKLNTITPIENPMIRFGHVSPLYNETICRLAKITK